MRSEHTAISQYFILLFFGMVITFSEAQEARPESGAPSFYLESEGFTHKNKETGEVSYSGKYAHFGKDIKKATVTGMIIQGEAAVDQVYDNDARDKVAIEHSINHKGRSGYY